MKKTLITLAAAVLAVSAFAQGSLNFGNQFSGFISPIYGPDPANVTLSLSGNSALSTPAGATVYGGSLLTGTSFTMELWAGAAGVTDPNLLTLVAGSTRTFRTSTGAALPKGLVTAGVVSLLQPGAIASLQVRVWDNTTGASWALAATRGATPIFASGQLGGTDALGNIFLTPNSTGFTSFNIYTVPEPGTIVLAGLGAASLLIFRRRK
jgi:hypothetical protein